jgi:hypothetical protein
LHRRASACAKHRIHTATGLRRCLRSSWAAAEGQSARVDGTHGRGQLETLIVSRGRIRLDGDRGQLEGSLSVPAVREEEMDHDIPSSQPATSVQLAWHAGDTATDGRENRLGQEATGRTCTEPASEATPHVNQLRSERWQMQADEPPSRTHCKSLCRRRPSVHATEEEERRQLSRVLQPSFPTLTAQSVPVFPAP